VLSPFFPKLDISGALQRGQQAISGVDDNFQSVKKRIEQLGITQNQIDKVAGAIEANPMARTLCNRFAPGKTPKMIADQIRMLGKGNMNNKADAPYMTMPKTNQARTFHRL